MDVFPSNCVTSGSELNIEAEDVEMASREGTSLGCTQENSEKDACSVRSRDGVEQGVAMSSNDSGEGESSGNRGGQANTPIAYNVGGEGSSKEVGLRKRKKNNGKEVGGDKNKEDQGVANNGGESQQKSPKGQATNSHSLAERARREKISERMKLLQDLVPGCSKVTGKAVMLDEIINYVQSLQRQVEFLSMKLATVNPQIDSHIEGILAKEMMLPRAGTPQLEDELHNVVQMGFGGGDVVPGSLDNEVSMWDVFEAYAYHGQGGHGIVLVLGTLAVELVLQSVNMDSEISRENEGKRFNIVDGNDNWLCTERIPHAERVFDRMPNKIMISWTAMIVDYGQKTRVKTQSRLMLRYGTDPGRNYF
ncbi:hypothetical protein MLD38_005524 [Melastoma candidum]|uniref:Uncharacterized protein n=1 Tax=Melastoma candidum TaxID=119954 RepID=A0ACB9RJI1_9MYRT|nr:hypothetical protein MLD38_005524 [Melastoma candidum]